MIPREYETKTKGKTRVRCTERSARATDESRVGVRSGLQPEVLRGKELVLATTAAIDRQSSNATLTIRRQARREQKDTHGNRG